MAKQLNCAEVGLDPGCGHVVRGETEEEILSAATQHAKEVHGARDEDFDQATVDKVRSLIRDV
jgi:predicted small metal-binding protein